MTEENRRSVVIAVPCSDYDQERVDAAVRAGISCFCCQEMCPQKAITAGRWGQKL